MSLQNNNELSINPGGTAAKYRPKVYAAGPDVFKEHAHRHFEDVKALFDKLGYELLCPLDLTLHLPEDIVKRNKELIRACDVVVANVTPFRGVEPDSGTVWEMGFAHALNKPVVMYTDGHGHEVIERTRRHFKEVDPYFQPGDIDGNLVWPDGMPAEDFDLPFNIMLMESSDLVYGNIRSALSFVDRLAIQRPEA